MTQAENNYKLRLWVLIHSCKHLKQETPSKHYPKGAYTCTRKDPKRFDKYMTQKTVCHYCPDYIGKDKILKKYAKQAGVN